VGWVGCLWVTTGAGDVCGLRLLEQGRPSQRPCWPDQTGQASRPLPSAGGEPPLDGGASSCVRGGEGRERRTASAGHKGPSTTPPEDATGSSSSGRADGHGQVSKGVGRHRRPPPSAASERAGGREKVSDVAPASRSGPRQRARRKGEAGACWLAGSLARRVTRSRASSAGRAGAGGQPEVASSAPQRAAEGAVVSPSQPGRPPTTAGRPLALPARGSGADGSLQRAPSQDGWRQQQQQQRAGRQAGRQEARAVARSKGGARLGWMAAYSQPSPSPPPS